MCVCVRACVRMCFSGSSLCGWCFCRLILLSRCVFDAAVRRRWGLTLRWMNEPVTRHPTPTVVGKTLPRERSHLGFVILLQLFTEFYWVSLYFFSDYYSAYLVLKGFYLFFEGRYWVLLSLQWIALGLLGFTVTFMEGVFLFWKRINVCCIEILIGMKHAGNWTTISWRASMKRLCARKRSWRFCE